MRKYFKIGIGTIVPVLLVTMVVYWLYMKVNNIVVTLLPDGAKYQWWYVILFVITIVIIIFIIGLLFSFLKPLQWVKDKIETKVINKIPYIRGIYKFGTEIVDSFVTDIKDDGELQVIEIEFGGLKSLGVLTDEANSLGFLLSAPSPVTGYVFKIPSYVKLDMTFMEAVKINTSLGKIGGDKWKS